jgi:hypothetical protein
LQQSGEDPSDTPTSDCYRHDHYDEPEREIRVFDVTAERYQAMTTATGRQMLVTALSMRRFRTTSSCPGIRAPTQHMAPPARAWSGVPQIGEGEIQLADQVALSGRCGKSRTEVVLMSLHGDQPLVDGNRFDPVGTMRPGPFIYLVALLVGELSVEVNVHHVTGSPVGTRHVLPLVQPASPNLADASREALSPAAC